MSTLTKVSSSPHVRSTASTDQIMRDVIIALIPATLVGFYVFGLNAIINIVLAIASAVLFEYLYQRLTHRKITVADYSAVVTGLLLGLNIPAGNHFLIPVIGSFFAVIVVKQLFGGIGQNFMNPALAARAFLIVSFAEYMTTWPLDGVTTATPLALIKAGHLEEINVMNSFLGQIPGSIGETSALALLIGGGYLLVRKVINWRIPMTYLGSLIVMMVLFSGYGFNLDYLGAQIFSGGLILGAFFMATDYSSSPMTGKGQIIMGLGCGIITALIRLFGGYPEGVSFAILIMNLFVPLIDRYTVPRAFGGGQ